MIQTGTLRAKTFSPEYLMISDGLMASKSLMIVGGPPKTYKSFILNTVLAHLCTGTPLFGASRKEGSHILPAFRVQRPYRVVLFEQEIGEFSYQERIDALVKGLPEEQAALVDENLWVHSCDRKLRLDQEAGVHTMDELLDPVKPDVICLDPLVEFHGCDENDTKEMSSVMRSFDYLRERHKCSIIVSHHCGKPKADQPRQAPDLLRGNSVIFGKGDTYLMLEMVNPDARIIKIKSTIRRGKPIRDFYVRLNKENLRFEFDGWDIKATRNRHSALAKQLLNNPDFDDE